MNNIPWQHSCCFIKRYMPLEDGCSIRQIIGELDSLVERGYGAIHITAPYDSPGFHPWWGLRVRNPFRLNPVLGDSMAEFAELVRQCHTRGLRVMVFLNTGYGELTSELWQNACRDRREGLDTPLVRFFQWSDTGTEPPPPTTDPCFPREEWWAWSEEAQAFYRAYWNGDAMVPGLYEPQYDWSSPELRGYLSLFVRHWMDTGVDCVILDAVSRYLNCDMHILRSWCEDILADYPEACLIPEGAADFGESMISWLNAGFSIVEDQKFHSEWLGSPVCAAAYSGSAAGLKTLQKNCHLARSWGRVCWSYQCWGKTWTNQLRLLEIAVLLATGHMTEIMPGYLTQFSAEERGFLDDLTRLGHNPALAPIRPRYFPDYEDDALFLCGGESWIFVASFCCEARYFRPFLPNGIVLRDMIYGETYKAEWGLELEPYGWRFFKIC